MKPAPLVVVLVFVIHHAHNDRSLSFLHLLLVPRYRSNQNKTEKKEGGGHLGSQDMNNTTTSDYTQVVWIKNRDSFVARKRVL